MLKLKVIIASTRPGRIGKPVGDWVAGVAAETGLFEVDLVDLAEINLPIMDEPNHPRLRQYTHQHTRDWSARIEPADAVVFVTPEYNHAYPASLKNAIDYLNAEWSHRVAGFVSYGGVSAGTRAVQALKTVVISVDMVPVNLAVAIPYPAKQLNEQREFVADHGLTESARHMFARIAEMARVMKAVRAAR